MDWSLLLGCVSLWTELALAEVGSFQACRRYFYKATEPHGFDTANLHQICQRYNNQYHFATLYDQANRIPRWSAYTLSGSDCPGQPKRRSKWFVEPQLGDDSLAVEMTTETASTLTMVELRSSQAINENYEDTSYDRGHLNPNSFQCDHGRKATFTLTNAAPMDPCFNRIRWSQVEKNLKTQLTENCIREKGTPYLVTGTVPSDNLKIPRMDEDKEDDRDREYNQVTVPRHIWTAVCCDHLTDNNRKFSFAFLAENIAESRLQVMTVEQLNLKLSRLYHTRRQFSIFADDCNSQSPRGQVVLSKMKSALSNAFRSLLSNHYSPSSSQKRSRPHQNPKITNLCQKSVGFLMSFPSLADWSIHFKKMYKQDSLTCVLVPDDDDAGVAETSGTSDRECTLQEQKYLPDSHVSAKGWSCVGHVCGKHEGKAYSWCYTSYNKDWDYCCTEKCTVNSQTNQYECSQGGSYIPCSPQYSTVTVSGKACRADHPCGLYEKNYFWCFTDDEWKWDYCCSPQHYCGDHGNGYQWCYTKDPQSSWQYCKLQEEGREQSSPVVIHEELRY